MCHLIVERSLLSCSTIVVGPFGFVISLAKVFAIMNSYFSDNTRLKSQCLKV